MKEPAINATRSFAAREFQRLDNFRNIVHIVANARHQLVPNGFHSVTSTAMNLVRAVYTALQCEPLAGLKNLSGETLKSAPGRLRLTIYAWLGHRSVKNKDVFVRPAIFSLLIEGSKPFCSVDRDKLRVLPTKQRDRGCIEAQRLRPTCFLTLTRDTSGLLTISPLHTNALCT